MNRLFVLLGLCFALLVAQIAIGQNYTVVDLGVLPGGTFSQGYGINQSGQVTGLSTTSNQQHAFLYSNGAMQDLGPLSGGHFSQGQGINESGQVAGYGDTSTSNYSYHAFLYSNGALSDLGTLPGGVNYALAWAINKSGQVVGTSAISGNTFHAFLYDGTSTPPMKDLGTLPYGTNSQAFGINQSGQVTGSANVGQNQHAFLYSNGAMQDLDSGGNYSYGLGINQSGHVVGYADSGPSFNHNAHAFLYDGAMHDLGTLPGGTYSQAYGINQSGQVVGYSDLGAFLYSGGTMKNLNSLIPPNSGWSLIIAYAINDSGQITGYGTINGTGHAFLLSPPAVPFASFKPQAAIDLKSNAFLVGGTFTLGTTSDGIAPLTEPVQLKLGTFSTTLPAGSFKKNGGGFMFSGTINGVKLDMLIQPTGKGKYFFAALARGANLAGTVNPVTVGLTIGNDTGSVSITAFFE